MAQRVIPYRASNQMVHQDKQVAGQELVSQIHKADHALDIERFLAMLDPNVSMRLGSQPAFHGIEAVRSAIAGLFAELSAIRHQLIHLIVEDNLVTFEAEVTYSLKNAQVITLPYVDVLRLAPSGLVNDYRIYIDLAPLFAALNG